MSSNDAGFSTFAFPERLCAKGLERGSSDLRRVLRTELQSKCGEARSESEREP